MAREEKRKIERTEYNANAVIVICNTQKTLLANVFDVSPLGMGITVGEDCPNIRGKDIILVSDTLIMYAKVTRMVKRDDGRFEIGIKAEKFTQDVLQYLFASVSDNVPL